MDRFLVRNVTGGASNTPARISGNLGLDGVARSFTIANGAAPIDMDVTAAVSNGGIIKEGPGVLRLGAANTFALGTTLNAGTLLIGHDSALGPGPLTANAGTLQADGAARTISNAIAGAGFAVDGAFDLTLNTSVNLAGGIFKNGAGTLTFGQASAVGGPLTINAGAVRVDVAVTLTGALANSGTVLLGTQTLTVNGAQINNQGSLQFTGGTLTGGGSVVNGGLISGNGTISGSGGFTNNAQLTVSSGNFTLSKSGANLNTGAVDVPAGLQLRLAGGTLANNGTVALAGGVVAGTATLNNNPGGIVSGRGLISAPLANAGGTLRAVGGTLHVTSDFTSSGLIRLDDAAGLAGGAITNTGLIRGDGTIANALTNAATGSIRVDAGKTLDFTGAFAPNAGELNLQGGTADFAGAITNGATGYITGHGALYAAGLTNNGPMAFSGGNTDLHGDVTNRVGAVVTTGGGGVTTFFDDVVNQGQIRTNAGSRTVIFGAVSGAGSFPGTGVVEQLGDTRPGNSPAIVSYGGDLLFADTSQLFIELGGATAGSQHDRITVASSVFLDGALDVSLINGFTPTLPGQTFTIVTAATRSGEFSDLLGTPNAVLPGLQWTVTYTPTSAILSTTALPGDIDLDGDVDRRDTVLFTTNLGRASGSIWTTGDFNFDGMTTLADLALQQANFGMTFPSPSASPVAAVPEPGTWLLAVLVLPVVRRWAGQRRPSRGV